MSDLEAFAPDAEGRIRAAARKAARDALDDGNYDFNRNKTALLDAFEAVACALLAELRREAEEVEHEPVEFVYREPPLEARKMVREYLAQKREALDAERDEAWSEWLRRLPPLSPPGTVPPLYIFYAGWNAAVEAMRKGRG